MIYDNTRVVDFFNQNLNQAKGLLKQLEICRDREPRFSALSGWVFEQTIRHCICEELGQTGIFVEPKEQFGLGGGVKADLLVGKTAIELKTRGLFGRKDITRYAGYKDMAEKQNYQYVFLSQSETYVPYRTGITEALGAGSVFFLDGPVGEWKRFIELIITGLREPTT